MEDNLGSGVRGKKKSKGEPHKVICGKGKEKRGKSVYPASESGSPKKKKSRAKVCISKSGKGGRRKGGAGTPPSSKGKRMSKPPAWPNSEGRGKQNWWSCAQLMWNKKKRKGGRPRT